MSTGEAQDGQWRGYPICHDLAGVRKLRRGSQDLPVQVSRSKFGVPPRSSLLLLCHFDGVFSLNIRTDWDETQSTRGENQARPTSSGYGGPVGGGSGGGGSVQGSASASGAAGFTGQAENASELLNPTHGLNSNENEATNAYGYPSAVSTGHNGISNDNF